MFPGPRLCPFSHPFLGLIIVDQKDIKSSEFLKGVSVKSPEIECIPKVRQSHLGQLCYTEQIALLLRVFARMTFGQGQGTVCRAVGTDLHIYQALSLMDLTFAQQ